MGPGKVVAPDDEGECVGAEIEGAEFLIDLCVD